MMKIHETLTFLIKILSRYNKKLNIQLPASRVNKGHVFQPTLMNINSNSCLYSSNPRLNPYNILHYYVKRKIFILIS